MTGPGARGPGALAAVLPALVVALTVVAFLPALGAGFVNWDDPENLLGNPHYRGLGAAQLRWMASTFHMGVYVPLAWLTLGLDYTLWGMDPRGYHLTSVLFHAGAALAFYFLALRLLRAALAGRAGEIDLRLGAAAAALAFAVHPLRVESVAWVTERRDVVSGLLAVLCLLAYLRHAAGGRRAGAWYWLALLLFAGALAAKVITAMLAPVLLVLDVYPLGRLGGRAGWRAGRVWLEKAPFFALGGLASAVGFLAVAAQSHLHALGEMDLPFRLVLSVWSVAFYLEKTLVPLGLSPLYQLPVVVTWRQFAAVGGLAVAAVLLRRRWPGLAAALVAYLVVLFPVAGIFHNGPQAAADRYTYLACMSWALLAGGLVARRWAGAAAVRAVAAVALAGLAALTWQQARVWHDGVSLWSQAVAVNPQSRAAHGKLGEAHAERGDLPAAVAHYAEAMRLSIDRAPYHAIIGRLLARGGEPALALQHFAAALRLRPGLPEACDGLAALGPSLSVPEEATRSCRPRPPG